MPLLLWKGPGHLEEVDLTRARAPELVTPSSPNDSPDLSPETFHYCTVQDCNKKFKKAMLAARHFNKDHADLYEDKDTWRDFVEEAE